MSLLTASEQKSCITAMMLGDAYTDCNDISGKARLDIYHRKEDLELLEWKKEILEDVTGLTARITEKADSRELLSGSTREGYRLQTNFSSYLYKLHKAPFKYKAKRAINPIGLAILWMDDGTLVMRAKRTGRAKVVLDPKDRSEFSTANLCTDSWTYEECKYFIQVWNNSLGWSPILQDYTCRGKVYPRLRLRKEMSIKLSYHIQQYMCNCMEYKLLF